MKILFFLIPFFSSYVFLSCADSAEKPQISEESFEKLKTRATGLFEKGRTDDSISLVKEFVRQAEEEFGPDDLNLIVPREYLSRLYLKARKYAQVEKIYQRNIEILEAGLGENNPKLADYLNNLAVFYLRQKKYEQSETYLMKALNIYLKVNGETHENVVTARANIAALGEIMRIPERPKKNQKEGIAENEKKPYHTGSLVAYPFRRSVDTLIFDGAGLLGETEMEQTEKILASIKNEGDALVFVVIVKSMASYGAVGWSPDVYAGNLLEKWGKGDKGKSRVLLFVSVADHCVSLLATGQRFDEEKSSLAKIREDIVLESFRKGKFAEGVFKGVQMVSRNMAIKNH